MPIFSREEPTPRQQSLTTYMKTIRPYLDRFFSGDTKVAISYLDRDYERFANATQVILDMDPVGNEEIRKNIHVIKTRTRKRKLVIPDSEDREFASGSRALLLGSQPNSEVLYEVLYDFKRDYEFSGLLYLGVKSDGSEKSNLYINEKVPVVTLP